MQDKTAKISEIEIAFLMDPYRKRWGAKNYDAYFPSTNVEEIKQSTGWDLKVSSDIKVVPEPTEREPANLRTVDMTGPLHKKG